MEGFNSRVRRTIAGVFHHISPQHADPRVPPALQLVSVFRAATGRQMRRSPDGGIIIKSTVAVLG